MMILKTICQYSGSLWIFWHMFNSIVRNVNFKASNFQEINLGSTFKWKWCKCLKFLFPLGFPFYCMRRHNSDIPFFGLGFLFFFLFFFPFNKINVVETEIRQVPNVFLNSSSAAWVVGVQELDPFVLLSCVFLPCESQYNLQSQHR